MEALVLQGHLREEIAYPLLIDMAIHQFDLARDLIGSQPEAVYCESFNPAWSWYAGDAAAEVVFEFAGEDPFQAGAAPAWKPRGTVPGGSVASVMATWDGDHGNEQARYADERPISAPIGLVLRADRRVRLAEFAAICGNATATRRAGGWLEAAIRSAATEGRRVTIAALLEDAYRGAVSAGQRPVAPRAGTVAVGTRGRRNEPRHCERNAEGRKTVSGSGQTTQLRIGTVETSMGAAHAQWRCNGHASSTAPGANADAVQAAADRLGFTSCETDWRRLVERDDIDLIDICTPGDIHSEIAIAALQAGKHVLCEKPLANTVEEAEQMAAAARAAAEREIWAMCGFTYRRTPALALARRLVDAGRIGAIRQVRADTLRTGWPTRGRPR